MKYIIINCKKKLIKFDSESEKNMFFKKNIQLDYNKYYNKKSHYHMKCNLLDIVLFKIFKIDEYNKNID